MHRQSLSNKHMYKKYLLILFVLTISLGIVKFGSNSMFIADSPEINPSFTAFIGNVPQNIAILFNPVQKSAIDSKPLALSGKSTLLTNQEANKLSEVINKLSFEKVSTGVYAAEENKVQYIKMVSGEVVWDQIKVKTKSGKVVILKYPKGESPVKEIVNVIESQ